MKEVVVPGCVLAIIASILLPLPAVVLDLLVVVNLLLGCVLLISTLYISDPLKLSSLPTLLLFATLLRLALNISTTRSILSTGTAGRVIEAFGEVVIQGNLVVGLVVFLIITIVQFVVIAKGAERVAEVAARFTLDALPGKQMSIDADVRAGLLDTEAARIKRQDLQIESRFYGALDGAMKFIKGDSIAGITSVVINIVGGLLIGTMVQGLALGRAATQYSVLTIGDGLAAQIPALLNALAAGMVVTRVVRGDGQSLASELPQQLGQLRVVKLLVGLLACVLAMLPGMPSIPFAVIGVGALILALVHVDKEGNLPIPSNLFEPKTPSLLSIEIGPQLRSLWQEDAQEVMHRINKLRDGLFRKYGVVIPVPELTIDPDAADSGRVLVRGVVASKFYGQSDRASSFDVLIESIQKVLVFHLPELMDDQHTRRILDILEKQSPELVAGVIPGVVTVTQLTVIMRELLKEGISLRNSELIVQSLAENGSKLSGERQLLERVRVALRRSICEPLITSNGKLEGFWLAPVLDLAFLKAEREGVPIDTLAITVVSEFLVSHTCCKPIIVVSQGARALVRDCVELKQLDATVLAYEEIPNELEFVRLGQIGDGISEGESNAVLERMVA